MKNKHKWKKVIKHFNSVGLKDLNNKAKLLDRSEVKYIVRQKDLIRIFHEMMKNFDILTIDGKNIFKYESIYMDTVKHEFYHKHNKGEKDRIKIRTRRYMDSDLTFFEFKHRNHGVVRKYRYAIDPSQHGQIDHTAQTFINDTHQAIYGADFSQELEPSMVTKYKRITLVHKNGGERVTIDLDLKLGLPDARKQDYNIPHIAIIELKTAEKRTATHDIFARHNISEKTACSKYCLAHYYLDETSERDHFKNTIAHITNLAQKDLEESLDEEPNLFVKDHTVKIKNSSLIIRKENTSV